MTCPPRDRRPSVRKSTGRSWRSSGEAVVTPARHVLLLRHATIAGKLRPQTRTSHWTGCRARSSSVQGFPVRGTCISYHDSHLIRRSIHESKIRFACRKEFLHMPAHVRFRPPCRPCKYVTSVLSIRRATCGIGVSCVSSLGLGSDRIDLP